MFYDTDFFGLLNPTCSTVMLIDPYFLDDGLSLKAYSLIEFTYTNTGSSLSNLNTFDLFYARHNEPRTKFNFDPVFISDYPWRSKTRTWFRSIQSSHYAQAIPFSTWDPQRRRIFTKWALIRRHLFEHRSSLVPWLSGNNFDPCLEKFQFFSRYNKGQYIRRKAFVESSCLDSTYNALTFLNNSWVNALEFEPLREKCEYKAICNIFKEPLILADSINRRWKIKFFLSMFLKCGNFWDYRSRTLFFDNTTWFKLQFLGRSRLVTCFTYENNGTFTNPKFSPYFFKETFNKVFYSKSLSFSYHLSQSSGGPSDLIFCAKDKPIKRFYGTNFRVYGTHPKRTTRMFKEFMYHFMRGRRFGALDCLDYESHRMFYSQYAQIKGVRYLYFLYLFKHTRPVLFPFLSYVPQFYSGISNTSLGFNFGGFFFFDFFSFNFNLYPEFFLFGYNFYYTFWFNFLIIFFFFLCFLNFLRSFLIFYFIQVPFFIYTSLFLLNFFIRIWMKLFLPLLLWLYKLRKLKYQRSNLIISVMYYEDILFMPWKSLYSIVLSRFDKNHFDWLLRMSEFDLNLSFEFREIWFGLIRFFARVLLSYRHKLPAAYGEYYSVNQNLIWEGFKLPFRGNVSWNLHLNTFLAFLDLDVLLFPALSKITLNLLLTQELLIAANLKLNLKPNWRFGLFYWIDPWISLFRRNFFFFFTNLKTSPFFLYFYIFFSKFNFKRFQSSRYLVYMKLALSNFGAIVCFIAAFWLILPTRFVINPEMEEDMGGDYSIQVLEESLYIEAQFKGYEGLYGNDWVGSFREYFWLNYNTDILKLSKSNSKFLDGSVLNSYTHFDSANNWAAYGHSLLAKDLMSIPNVFKLLFKSDWKYRPNFSFRFLRFVLDNSFADKEALKYWYPYANNFFTFFKNGFEEKWYRFFSRNFIFNLAFFSKFFLCILFLIIFILKIIVFVFFFFFNFIIKLVPNNFIFYMLKILLYFYFTICENFLLFYLTLNKTFTVYFLKLLAFVFNFSFIKKLFIIIVDNFNLFFKKVYNFFFFNLLVKFLRILVSNFRYFFLSFRVIFLFFFLCSFFFFDIASAAVTLFNDVYFSHIALTTDKFAKNYIYFVLSYGADPTIYNVYEKVISFYFNSIRYLDLDWENIWDELLFQIYDFWEISHYNFIQLPIISLFWCRWDDYFSFEFAAFLTGTSSFNVIASSLCYRAIFSFYYYYSIFLKLDYIFDHFYFLQGIFSFFVYIWNTAPLFFFKFLAFVSNLDLTFLNPASHWMLFFNFEFKDLLFFWYLLLTFFNALLHKGYFFLMLRGGFIWEYYVEESLVFFSFGWFDIFFYFTIFLGSSNESFLLQFQSFIFLFLNLIYHFWADYIYFFSPVSNNFIYHGVDFILPIIEDAYRVRSPQHSKIFFWEEFIGENFLLTYDDTVISNTFNTSKGQFFFWFGDSLPFVAFFFKLIFFFLVSSSIYCFPLEIINFFYFHRPLDFINEVTAWYRFRERTGRDLIYFFRESKSIRKYTKFLLRCRVYYSSPFLNRNNEAATFTSNFGFKNKSFAGFLLSNHFSIPNEYLFLDLYHMKRVVKKFLKFAERKLPDAFINSIGFQDEIHTNSNIWDIDDEDNILSAVSKQERLRRIIFFEEYAHSEFNIFEYDMFPVFDTMRLFFSDILIFEDKNRQNLHDYYYRIDASIFNNKLPYFVYHNDIGFNYSVPLGTSQRSGRAVYYLYDTTLFQMPLFFIFFGVLLFSIFYYGNINTAFDIFYTIAYFEGLFHWYGSYLYLIFDWLKDFSLNFSERQAFTGGWDLHLYHTGYDELSIEMDPYFHGSIYSFNLINQEVMNYINWSSTTPTDEHYIVNVAYRFFNFLDFYNVLVVDFFKFNYTYHYVGKKFAIFYIFKSLFFWIYFHFRCFLIYYFSSFPFVFYSFFFSFSVFFVEFSLFLICLFIVLKFWYKFIVLGWRFLLTIPCFDFIFDFVFYFFHFCFDLDYNKFSAFIFNFNKNKSLKRFKFSAKKFDFLVRVFSFYSAKERVVLSILKKLKRK